MSPSAPSFNQPDVLAPSASPPRPASPDAQGQPALTRDTPPSGTSAGIPPPCSPVPRAGSS
jgi:hypothetical protein